MNWIIIDWTGRQIFQQTFETFDDGEDFLCEHLGESYEKDRGDLFVVKKN